MLPVCSYPDYHQMGNEANHVYQNTMIFSGEFSSSVKEADATFILQVSNVPRRPISPEGTAKTPCPVSPGDVFQVVG